MHDVIRVWWAPWPRISIGLSTRFGEITIGFDIELSALGWWSQSCPGHIECMAGPLSVWASRTPKGHSNDNCSRL